MEPQTRVLFTFDNPLKKQRFFTFSSSLDTLYLLAVLRTKKFSQLNSREFLETYWKVRSKYPDWYKGFEPCTEEHFNMLRKS